MFQPSLSIPSLLFVPFQSSHLAQTGKIKLLQASVTRKMAYNHYCFPFLFIPSDSTVGAVFTVLAMPLNSKSLENALSRYYAPVVLFKNPKAKI